MALDVPVGVDIAAHDDILVETMVVGLPERERAGRAVAPQQVGLAVALEVGDRGDVPVCADAGITVGVGG